MTDLRNPRAEAQSLLGSAYDARVLEPSPPTVLDEPFLADDPVSTEWIREGAELVMPAGMAGGSDWNQWLANNPEHADWVSSRWLGGTRRLPALPASLAATRVALHKVAMFIVAPARYRENQKFGLRYTHGGFGTPFFGEDRQIRVEGSYLIDQHGDVSCRHQISSLAAAADFVGAELDFETAAEHDSPPPGDVHANLGIDPSAAAFLGDWYGMGFAALEVLRADEASVNPSRPQLWPGHFDPAIEVGDDDHRASYGASPGDPSIDEPYLYVSIWWPDKVQIDASDPIWNAPSFTGAILRQSDFDEQRDAVEVAADFWRQARDRLT